MRKSKDRPTPTLIGLAAAINAPTAIKRRERMRSFTSALIHQTKAGKSEWEYVLGRVSGTLKPADRTISRIVYKMDWRLLASLAVSVLRQDEKTTLAQPFGFVAVAEAITNGTSPFGWPDGWIESYAEALCSRIRRDAKSLIHNHLINSTVYTSSEADDMSKSIDFDAVEQAIQALTKDKNENGTDPKDALSKLAPTYSEDVLQAVAVVEGIEADEAKKLIDAGKKSGKAKAKAEPKAEATAKDTKTKIDVSALVPEDKRSFVDQALNMATGGSLPSIEQLLSEALQGYVDNSEAEAVKSEKDKLERELSALKATGPTKVEYEYKEADHGHIKIPSGRTAKKKLNELTKRAWGKTNKKWDFDVTVYEWDDEHPHVPAINPSFRPDPKLLRAIAYGIETQKPTWVHGHTGSGKTVGVEQFNALVGKPFVRINLDAGIERPEFVGKEVLHARSGVSVSEFVEGILPQAMKMPATFCVDEGDAGRADVMYVLQSLLEEGQTLRVPEDGGKKIVAAPGFSVVLTANSVGQGDTTGMYPAVRPQSQALLDRFVLWIEKDYDKPEQEVPIIMAKVPGCDEESAKKIAELAKVVRQSFVQGEIMMTMSLRAEISIAEHYAMFGDLVDACMDVVGNKASDMDQATVRGLIQRVTGK